MHSDIRDFWRKFVADGGEESFRPLYDATKALLYTICRRVLGNGEDAADAFQAAYCRLFVLVRNAKAPSGEEPECEIAAFLARLALREAGNLRDRRRRRAKREVVMDDLSPFPGALARPDEAAAQRELRGKIETLLALLPERYRLPLSLHHFDGMTQTEIARILGVPVRTVSDRIARGIRKLRPLMKRAGLREAAGGIAGLAAGAGLLDPPSALAAGAVYAQAQAFLVSGAGVALGAGVLSGTASASWAGKIASGVAVMKAKLLVVGILAAVGLAGLFAWQSGRTPESSRAARKPREDALVARQEISSAPDGTRTLPASTPTPVPLSEPYSVEKNVRTPVAQPPLPADAEIRGTVVQKIDGKDTPVEGAWVRVTDGLIHMSDDEPAQGFALDATTSSTANGAFEAAGLPYERNLYVLAGKGLIAARGTCIGKISQGSPRAPVAVRLPDASTVRGCVVDLENRPVAGAQVSAMFPYSQEKVSYGETVSDSQGRFVFPDLDANKRYSLIGKAEGYAEAVLNEVRPGSSEDAVIVLTPGREVWGRVVEGDSDRPVPDARLTLTKGLATYSPIGCDTRLANREAVSDEQGAFRFPAVPSGGFEISGQLEREGAGPNLVVEPVDGHTDVKMTDHVGAENVILRAWPAVTARGRVLDRANESGVEGARMKFYWKVEGRPGLSDQPAGETTSGPDGAFEVTDLAPGHYGVAIERDGYLSLGPDPDMGLRSPNLDAPVVDLRDAARAENLILHLDSGGRLWGKVLDPEGHPVAGVWVRSERMAQYRMFPVGSRTDETGAFAISPLNLDATYSVKTCAQGNGASAVSATVTLTAESPAAEVVLTLPEGGSVSGRVTDKAGTPVEGASVSAYPEPYSSLSAPWLPRTRSLDDGSYEIAGVAAGTWRVGAWKDGYGSADSEPIALRAGEDAAGVDLALEKAPSFHGALVDLGGAMLGNWEYTICEGKTGWVGSGNTAHDGTFDLGYDLARLKDEKFYLRFRNVCCRKHREPLMGFRSGLLSPSDEEEVFVLPISKGIRGRFVCQGTGEPVKECQIELRPIDRGNADDSAENAEAADKADARVPGAQCTLDKEETRLIEDVRAEDGRFDFPMLPVGTYRMDAWAPGAQHKTVDAIEVGPDGIDLGDIEIVRGEGSIRGRLIDVQTGQPIWVSEKRGHERFLEFCEYWDAETSQGIQSLCAVPRFDADKRFEIPYVPLAIQGAKVILRARARLSPYLAQDSPNYRWGAYGASDWRVAREVGTVRFDDQNRADLGDIPLWLGVATGSFIDAQTRKAYGTPRTMLFASARDASGAPQPVEYAQFKEDGSFVLMGVPREARRLILYPGGRLPVETDFSFPLQGDGVVGELEVTKGERLAGTVKTADGKPADEAKVVVYCVGHPGPAGAPWPLPFFGPDQPQGGEDYAAFAMTDDDGAFRVEGLYPGFVRVRAAKTVESGQAYMRLDSEERQCMIQPGVANEIEIRMSQ